MSHVKHIMAFNFMLTILSIIETKLPADNCRLTVVPISRTYISPRTV